MVTGETHAVAMTFTVLASFLENVSVNHSKTEESWYDTAVTNNTTEGVGVYNRNKLGNTNFTRYLCLGSFVLFTM